jgi:GNAT superfamily N-acetyltransferase
MKLSIKNIILGELDSYINSDEFKVSDFAPISRIRALSHSHNPRADQSDYCLFLAYDNQKIIGYLGAITDWLFDDKEKYKVYWLSCMWVLPDYRRHGVALKLLQHSCAIFEGNVLITNFIPSSRAAFDKTQLFTDFTALRGIRAYVKFDLNNILPRKNNFSRKISPILHFIDLFLNLPVWLKLKITQANFYTPCTFDEIEVFDKKLKQFIAENISESTFRRGAIELEWMKNYPWIRKVKQISKETSKYYFSQEGRDFRQWFLKVEDKGKIVGFLMLTLYRGELKTPYLIYDEKYTKEIASIIAQTIINEKVCTFIGYDKKVNTLLQKSGLFMHTRQSEYGFLISKTLKDKLSDNSPVLFDGDGDGGFT